MITREQALKLKHGDIIYQVYKANGTTRMTTTGLIFVPDNSLSLLSKPFKWRVNGKIQTWKTRPNDFKVPIKHGLYDYNYLTHETTRLFKLEG